MEIKRITFIVAGVLIAASVFFPYIGIKFKAPQYPDKSPGMFLYVHKITGDLKDWEVLVRYIGVNIYPELPELNGKMIVYLMFILGGFAILSAFIAYPKLLKICSIIILIIGLLLAGWAQFRLYQQGHSLDPKAPLRSTIKPFTPPLIGITKVHKIRIYHYPHIGSAFFGLAIVSMVLTSWLPAGRKKKADS